MVINKETESWEDDFGQVLYNVHEETEECNTKGCPIHSPSDHSMKDFKIYWRSDRGIMERICPHGIGHPDPDMMNYLEKVNPKGAWAEGVHGCDGCCK